VQKDLTAASSTIILLSLLAHEEDYGYSIIRRIRQLSSERLDWAEGMLYPVLHRLEQQGYLASCTRTVKSGRKRKYYRTTDAGLDYLEELRNDWDSMHAILDTIRSALQSC